MLNKLPDPELLLPLLAVPYVTASSHSQLGLHLADVLRTKKDLRPTVLQLLSFLGRPLGTNAQILAEIHEEDWAAATELASSNDTLDTGSRSKSGKHRRREKRRNGGSGVKPGNPEWVQFLVQQCFEVLLPELPLEECVVSESDGTRQYPIFYDEETDVPFAPTFPDEAARNESILKCNLLGRGVAEQKEVQLICLLAAKEFDALIATVAAVQDDKHYALTLLHKPDLTVSEEVALICDLATKEMEADIGLATVVVGDKQWFIPPVRIDNEITINESKESFTAHAILSENKPFLVRNAQLDVRFRNYKVASAKSSISFFFGVPVFAGDGVIVATLCAVDSKPRRNITTMQYSVMVALANVLSCIWKETYVPEDDGNKLINDMKAPWTLRLRTHGDDLS
ncbi:hypothetical protein PHMEG_0001529 [Phytophthora megakarya]|uniref:GAF domain-containing protein n=1 Tax=Phytophthora megakarya TaxID=4795 RepID=A0A225X1N0_9STRA|nr:hypothetical protein PHMEG_0001529 [Phytophthora megakarya]